MLLKTITMKAMLDSAGVLNIDKENLPKGSRIKQILSSTLVDSTYTIKDVNKRVKHYLVTLIIEIGNDPNKEADKDVSIILNPYL